MKEKYKRHIKITATLSSVCFVIIAIGFGCGMGFQSVGLNESVPIIGNDNNPTDIGENDDLVIVSNAKTVSVTNYTSVLDNMISLTNVTPSQATRTAFDQNINSFSDNGSALSVNAPMLMGYLTVGAEICDDLVDQETPLAAANRRFFSTVNLAANSTNVNTVTDAVIGDVVRRFARQFWQRNEDPEELTLIREGIREMIRAVAANTQGLTRRSMVYTCAAMISSTSAYEL